MYHMGPNDGGIKRGEGFESGDNEAARNEGTGPDGSGVRAGDDGPAGMPTFDASSEEEVYGGADGFEAEAGSDSGGIDDLTVLDANDPSLGLTNIGDIPPDDWAANTGSTRVPTRGEGLATESQRDRASTLKEKK